jgi:hypothetical protein
MPNHNQGPRVGRGLFMLVVIAGLSLLAWTKLMGA